MKERAPLSFGKIVVRHSYQWNRALVATQDFFGRSSPLEMTI